jgi:hypothetical protein
MPMSPKRFAAAAAGALMLASVALAQPAAASTNSDPGWYMDFYSGTLGTGTKTRVLQTPPNECQVLAQPAKTALNVTPDDLVIYANATCTPGAPGQYWVSETVTPLHYVSFDSGALSFKLVPTSNPGSGTVTVP